MNIVITAIECNYTKLYGDTELLGTLLDSCDVVANVISNGTEIECKFNLSRGEIVCVNGIPDYEQSVRNHLHKAFVGMAAE